MKYDYTEDYYDLLFGCSFLSIAAGLATGHELAGAIVASVLTGLALFVAYPKES